MNKILSKYGRELITAVAIIIMVIVFSSIKSTYLSSSNLVDIIDQATINGLLAIGITIVIITGGNDLSVGSIMAIVIVATGELLVNGINIFLAIIIAILIGMVLGLFNGFLVAKLKLQPFIATLGTMSIYRGIAYVITKGWPVLNIPENFRTLIDGDVFGNISAAIFILIGFAIIVTIVLNYTKLGVYIYSIGGNEEATKLSGVNVDKYKISAYVLCSVGAALAGLVMLARLGTGEPTAGQGYELNAIAATAIGGTSLSGGKGSVFGTLLGAILLSALKVGLVVTGVDTFWQYIATGIIIIIAASLEFFQNYYSQRKK